MKKLIAILLIATTIANASICNEIVTKEDEFTGKTTKRSPYGYSMSFIKYIDSDSIEYRLGLTANSSYYSTGEGVTIKFFDGTLYDFPKEEMDVERYDGKWEYYSYIKLTSEEVVMFQTKKIKMYKLWIFDEKTIPEESIRLNGFVNCLVDGETTAQEEEQFKQVETELERLFKKEQ